MPERGMPTAIERFKAGASAARMDVRVHGIDPHADLAKSRRLYECNQRIGSTRAAAYYKGRIESLERYVEFEMDND